MKTSGLKVASALAVAVSMGLTGMPSIAGELEELFFAYGCGRTLCSNSVETIPDSGLTRTRLVKTDRYLSDASITFTVIDGKRVIIAESLTIPIPGSYSRRHHVYELTDRGPSTTWFSTNTEGEYDFFVIRGREALAYTPYAREPVEQPVSTIIVTGH